MKFKKVKKWLQERLIASSVWHSDSDKKEYYVWLWPNLIRSPLHGVEKWFQIRVPKFIYDKAVKFIWRTGGSGFWMQWN